LAEIGLELQRWSSVSGDVPTVANVYISALAEAARPRAILGKVGTKDKEIDHSQQQIFRLTFAVETTRVHDRPAV
jgi:hypothetical protein